MGEKLVIKIYGIEISIVSFVEKIVCSILTLKSYVLYTHTKLNIDLNHI